MPPASSARRRPHPMGALAPTACRLYLPGHPTGDTQMTYRVAVVGATGSVGREMLKTLAERRFPVSEVVALASGRSTGSEVSFGDKQVLKVKNLETFDFH